MASAKELGIRLFAAVKGQKAADIRELLEAGAPTNMKGKLGPVSFSDVYDYAQSVALEGKGFVGISTLLTHAHYKPEYLNMKLAEAVENTFAELKDGENINLHVRILSELIKAGANINGLHDGEFIAFSALSSASLMRVLLRLGLNPNLEDKHGISLVMYARHRGLNDVVNVLKAAGAKGATDKFLEDIEPRFGVELEICVKLTPTCLGARVEGIDPKSDPWIKMFGIYATHYIKGTDVAKRLATKYGFVYVTDNEKYGYSYIYDLKKFELIPKKGKIAYDRPFFTIDRSVYCGDHMPGVNKPATRRAGRNRPARMTLRNSDEKLKNTFHIEFVSPILSSYADLEECLRLVGLGRPRCFISNISAGYHVNVSLLNTKTNKPVILSKEFFESSFFPRYKEWESETYPRVRKTVTKYAAPLAAMREADVFLKTGKSKYVALFRKNPYLFEFRLFGSNNRVPTLTKYTKDAVELLADAYDSYNIGLAIAE